jgi:hypothetical protein
MIVTILWRLEGEPAAIAPSSFKDVASGTWYTKSVAWAEENGIVKGYDADTFSPNNNISREQMATILYRYAQYKEYDVSKSAGLSSYTDAGQISYWASDAFVWGTAEKLITGTTSTTLLPRGNATRAQVATILMRFIENIAK